MKIKMSIKNMGGEEIEFELQKYVLCFSVVKIPIKAY